MDENSTQLLLPPLDECGFVKVPADKPLWMTCESCKKSDHFWMTETEVRCRCGATYTHAVTPDGRSVPRQELIAVPFNKGPIQLADLEWNPARLVFIGLALISVVTTVGWFFLS
jgi:hypothetical protein